MSNGTGDAEPSFGFLSVVELADGGSCGGLLVLDRIGRPMEFHLTVPVVPNRAQEILYGRTLKPFVACELIGKALVNKIKSSPTILFIDSPTLFDLIQHIDCPVAFPHADDPSQDQVQNAEETSVKPNPDSAAILSQKKILQIEEPSVIDLETPFVEVVIDSIAFSIRQQSMPSSEEIESKLRQMNSVHHITEPFERIHEAIAQAKMAA